MHLNIFFTLVLLLYLPSIKADTNLEQKTAEKLLETESKNQTLWTYRGLIKTKIGPVPYEIHAPQNQIEFAQRVREILQVDGPKVVEYFGVIPQTPANFTLADGPKFANGAATAFPHNIIILNNYPPIGYGHLANNRDWLKVLVLHELTHILHLDQTSGVPEFLRYIFGSWAKFGGLVPRWFSEGVAVWVESELVQNNKAGGRLNNPLMEYEFYSRFTSDGCSRIDCLDDPGIYPYLSYPYWAGAYFAQYLEKIKQGSLACIITANSDSFLFFFNSAVYDCMGKGVVELFADFRNYSFLRVEKLKQYNTSFKRSQRLVKLPKEEKSYFIWQRGGGFQGDLLALANEDNEKTYLTLYQSKSKKYFKFRPPYPLQHIHLNAEKTAIWVTLFDIYDQANRLYRFDLKKQRFDKVEYSHGEMFFPIDQSKYYQMYYSDSRWVLKKKTYDKKSPENSKPEFKFPKNMSVMFPTFYRINGINYMMFATESVNHIGKHHRESPIGFYLFNLDTLSWVSKIFESTGNLRPAGRCGNDLFLLEHEGKNKSLVRIPIGVQGPKQRFRRYKSASINDLVHINMNDTKTLVTLHSDVANAYSYEGSCEDFIKEVNQNGGSLAGSVTKRDRPLVVAMKRSNITPQASVVKKKISQKEEVLEKDWESYPSLRHFKPTHLTLFYTSADNLSRLDAMTALMDPKSRHILGLGGSYYTTGSEFGPVLSYTYQRKYGAFFRRSFTANSVNTETLFENESKGVFVTHNFDWGKFKYVPSLSYAMSDINDVLSNRETKRVTFGSSLNTQGVFWDDFWSMSSFNLDVFQESSNRFDSYFGLDSKWKNVFRFDRDWKGFFNIGYGKLFKDIFSSGTIYAGGVDGNIFANARVHEFYGLAYSDAFGNDVLTSRAQLEYVINRPYKGAGTTPLFFKKLALFAGAEYLKTDFFFIDDTLKTDLGLYNVHGGVRFDVNIAYLAPVEVDVLVYNILNSEITEDNFGYILLLKGSLF